MDDSNNKEICGSHKGNNKYNNQFEFYVHRKSCSANKSIFRTAQKEKPRIDDANTYALHTYFMSRT